MTVPDSTDTDRLAEIRARLDAATTWPWHVTEFDDDHAMSLIAVATVADTDDPSEIVAATLVQAPRYADIADDRWHENAELIANAPADLSWLLSELEAAQARADQLQKRLDAANSRYSDVVLKLDQTERALDYQREYGEQLQMSIEGCSGHDMPEPDAEALGLGEEAGQ